ncbi:hypothetical protein [Caulobacter sp. UC70_42]|uniref:hypothetical protein n=1 Tax=Caulobacter sp. UC70_42 TaxID=3374551 RepID=UPI0037565FFC
MSALSATCVTRSGGLRIFGVTGDLIHFTLPTRWSGVRDGAPFKELGGWTFVQVREDDRWRIRSYGWAVVEFAWEA